VSLVIKIFTNSSMGKLVIAGQDLELLWNSQRRMLIQKKLLWIELQKTLMSCKHLLISMRLAELLIISKRISISKCGSNKNKTEKLNRLEINLKKCKIGKHKLIVLSNLKKLEE
jgi:hypothetical protein